MLEIDIEKRIVNGVWEGYIGRVNRQSIRVFTGKRMSGVELNNFFASGSLDNTKLKVYGPDGPIYLTYESIDISSPGSVAAYSPRVFVEERTLERFIENFDEYVEGSSGVAKAAAQEALDAKEELTTNVGQALEELDEVKAANQKRYLDAVSTVAERDSAYPTPENGDSVWVSGEGKMYRYDGTVWKVTNENDPSAIDMVSQQLAETSKELSYNVVARAEKYGANPKDLSFDSTSAIQAAINFVAGLGGGEVRLNPGTYRTSSPLKLKKNVSLVGSGMGSTKLLFLSTGKGNVIELETNAWKTDPTYQRIEHLTIDGNNTAQYGIFASSSVFYTYINNVHVKSAVIDGLKYISSHRNRLTNVVSSNNGGNGITITTEVREGIGSATDNHVEMSYVTCDSNTGHGLYMVDPVDIKLNHIVCAANNMDGLHMINPSGGWCNVIETLVCQGNRNGLVIDKGSAVQLSNVGISASREYNMKLLELGNSLFTNVSLNGGTNGNLYAWRINRCSFSNVTSAYPGGTSTINNIDIATAQYCNFSGFVVFGGQDGIYLRSGSNHNSFNNLQVANTSRYGVNAEGTASIPLDFNSFNNVAMRDVVLTPFTASSGLRCAFANRTAITNFRNSDGRTSKVAEYGIDLSTGHESIVSNSHVYGKVGGIRKHETNTTSIIDNTVIQGTYV